MTTLALHNVGVGSREKPRLDGVSLTFSSAECVVVVGPNGAGKTTLLRVALGLLPCERGSAELDGAPIRRLSPRERASKIAWLRQQALIDEPLSATEVVASARYRFDEAHSLASQKALRVLAEVDAEDLAPRKATELSGGERQRVALAALLAQEAPLLLLDEPGNHLDPAHQLEVYARLGRLWQRGFGVLCVTHDINLVSFFGDASRVRVLGLLGGRLEIDTHYSDPDLPELLSKLYNVEMLAIETADRRIILPQRGRSNAAPE